VLRIENLHCHPKSLGTFVLVKGPENKEPRRAENGERRSSNDVWVYFQTPAVNTNSGMLVGVDPVWEVSVRPFGRLLPASTTPPSGI
jgi:hypothetical protein